MIPLTPISTFPTSPSTTQISAPPTSPSTTTATMFEETTTTTTTRSTSPSISVDSIIIPNYDSIVYNFVESRQYKAALALNNIGVSLLEGGAYRDALTTFQRAFELIREITNTSTLLSSQRNDDGDDDDHDDESRTGEEELCCFIYDRPEILESINTNFTIAQQQLRACQQRQRRRRQIKKRKSKNNKSTSVDCASISPSSTYCEGEYNFHDQDHYFFDVAILHEDNYKELLDAADSYPIQNTGYAIRIDTSCEFFTSNFVLQSSTIIMNYAIAYRCLINIPNSSRYNNSRMLNAQRELKYIRSSYKLFTVAFRLLQQESIEFHTYLDDDTMYEPHPQSSVVEQANWIIQERIELMMILAVQALMHMSFDLDLPIEGQEYYSLLGDLHIGHVKCEAATKETILHILAPAA